MAEFQPIPREQLFTRGGKSTIALERAMAVFTPELMGALVAAMDKLGTATGTLRLINEGEHPQTVEAILSKLDGKSGRLEVELKADFAKGQERLLGAVPFYTTFSGKLFRRENVEATEPIAKEGDLLIPPKPMIVGKASARKGTYWNYELDPESYPKGVRIVEFTVADVRDGVDVVYNPDKPDESTILFYGIPQ